MELNMMIRDKKIRGKRLRIRRVNRGKEGKRTERNEWIEMEGWKEERENNLRIVR